jgi:hypothetical protein
MEALYPHDIATTSNRERSLPETLPSGAVFLAQPEMRELVEKALSLGWTLVPYEADLGKAGAIKNPQEQINWRDAQQGELLAKAVSTLSQDAKVLVWCGLGHLKQSPEGEWRPMGYQFYQSSGIRAFAIDQTVTINRSGSPAYRSRIVEKYRDTLEKFGGSAGFLSEEGVPPLLNSKDVDAFIVSTENEME